MLEKVAVCEQKVVEVNLNQQLHLEKPWIAGEGEVHDSSIVRLLVDCLAAGEDVQGFGNYFPRQEQYVPVGKVQELGRKTEGEIRKFTNDEVASANKVNPKA